MELFRGLGVLAEPPTDLSQGVADGLELGALPRRAEHTELFSLQLRPYGSIYLSDDGHLGGEARDRVAGFWRAFGLEAPRECDHLTVLLAFYAELAVGVTATGTTAAERLKRAHQRQAFLNEHILSWVPLYLLKLRQLAPDFYRRWATLLARALRREYSREAEAPMLSIHLRSATKVPSPSECGAGELRRILTTPARSGLILTRKDLSQASRELGLARRVGERGFMLKAMMSQAPGELLGWLSDHVESERRACALAAREWGAHLSVLAGRLALTKRLIDNLVL